MRNRPAEISTLIKVADTQVGADVSFLNAVGGEKTKCKEKRNRYNTRTVKTKIVDRVFP